MLNVMYERFEIDGNGNEALKTTEGQTSRRNALIILRYEKSEEQCRRIMPYCRARLFRIHDNPNTFHDRDHGLESGPCGCTNWVELACDDEVVGDDKARGIPRSHAIQGSEEVSE